MGLSLRPEPERSTEIGRILVCAAGGGGWLAVTILSSDRTRRTNG